MIAATMLGAIAAANESDLDLLVEAISARRRVLRDQQTRQIAALLDEGTVVTLDGLTPKALNGLTGAVENIKVQRADVRLDEKSTARLSWANTKHAAHAQLAIGRGEGYLIIGVPISCLTPKED